MILTSLVDNIKLSDRPDITIERGLSIHANTMGKNILFDAGSSKTFCNNAALLNIDINNVDAAVISHHHHDHCNGMMHFLKNNKKAPVYLRECDEKKYWFKAFGFKINVGINKQLLSNASGRLIFIKEITEISSNIFIITDISNKHAKPKGNKYLYTETSDYCTSDTFNHELLLVVKEHDGLIVFTGCAHSGILNMLETATKYFPNTKIKAIVGGFHLVGLPFFNSIAETKKKIENIGELILDYPIDKLYTGHCTGMKAFNILKGVLGDRLEYFPTGHSIRV